MEGQAVALYTSSTLLSREPVAPTVKLVAYIFLSMLLSSCAHGEVPAAVVDSQAQSRLEAALRKRDELAQQFANSPPPLREKCELSAGDCMIEIRDQRSSLLARHPDRLVACPDSADLDARLRCAALAHPEPVFSDNGPPPDTTPEFSRFYSREGACLKEMITCTVTAVEQAAASVREAKKEKHRGEVEGTAEAVAARTAVSTVTEKAKYVRMTLPVRCDDLCPPGDELDPCLERAQAQLGRFEDELSKDTGYDAKAALDIYTKSHVSEAACYEPELKCLLAKLSDFGATGETRQMVDRNLSLIEERQRLVGQVSANVATRCIDEGKALHQANILQRFQDYVGQSKLYFRFQLDRAFMDMHAAQISCLKSRLGKSGKGQR